MTHQQCTDFVWGNLPIRKHMLGRRVVRRMVSVALLRAAEGYSASDAADSVAADARERESTMGVVLALFLSALVNQIVNLVFEWLQQRNRDE